MCGIVGVCNLSGEPVASDLLRRMTEVMAHRGPDDEGFHTDEGVGLAQRRLAILDLTKAGHQPMSNEAGDVVITYGGEIYNFRELRAELEALGYCFRSRTDTEVVLRAYERWGPECVQRFNGMFAFAIWDRERRQLFLARDRYGVKPLYWHWNRGLFIFASEIKAILEHPRVPRELCYPALNEYFTFQNVFSDLTLFQSIRLLPPGCTLISDVRGGSLPDIRRYWDYSTPEGPSNVSEDESAEAVHHLFEQAVTRQLVSDVPVGTYLSGGMDSSSITAIAASHVPRLHTFTAGFDLTSASGLELGFDERHAAETVSNELKTQHYEVVMHAGDMEWVLPKLIWHLEDLRVGQCYPNYYAAGLAGKFVKVILSGAGGDELFGGYPWRYFRGLDCNGREDYYGRYYDFWQRLVPDDDKVRLFNDETKRRVADHSTFDVFRGVFADWPGAFRSTEDYVNASLYFELRTFLHGLLVVEDKLSMAHSLETRVPFLDNDLVDLALRIPARSKLRNLDRLVPMDENDVGKRLLYGLATNDGKAVLRKAMRRLIPRSVAERRKQGFSAPDASWFRGESIDYLNGLLRDPGARMYEFVRPEYVSSVLDEHSSGRVNHRLLIWSLLSFEWWCRVYLFADVEADLIGRPSDDQAWQRR